MPMTKREVFMQIRPPHTISHAADGLPDDDLTPDVVREWVALCAELGVTGIYWMVNYVGKATYHSKVFSPMVPVQERHFVQQGIGPGTAAKLFTRIEAALARFDTLDVALAAAKEHGIALYADLGFFDQYFPGLESVFFEEHPELWLRGRKRCRPTQMYGQVMPEPYQRLVVSDDPYVLGQTWFRGLACYAEPAVQDYWLAIVGELMERGVDHFAFNLTSHVQNGFGNTWRVVDGDEGSDAFGFNQPVVVEFEKRHGVNILEKGFEAIQLHDLQGEFFTGFLRRIRGLIGADRHFAAATTLDGLCGYGVNAEQFRMTLQWPKWMEEGIANDLMVYDQGREQTTAEQVDRQIKSKLSRGRVFLWRTISDAANFNAFQHTMEEACRGRLDGYGMKELAGIVQARAGRA